MSLFHPEEEPRPRSWRWAWIALALVLVGAVGYYFEQRAARFHDLESLQADVKAAGDRYAGVDRDFAARMDAHRGDSPFQTFGPEQAIDANTRAAVQAWVAAGVRIIDESLAGREAIAKELSARIEASRRAGPEKDAMLKSIQTAAEKTLLSRRTMEATRAYLAKIGEMAALLDANAQAIQLREGQLEFDDSAAGERYNVMEHEAIRLGRTLANLQRQARR